MKRKWAAEARLVRDGDDSDAVADLDNTHRETYDAAKASLSAAEPAVTHQTHCQLGDSLFPLKEGTLDQFLKNGRTATGGDEEGRNGLRIVANRLLPEEDLVEAPTNTRLVAAPDRSFSHD